MQDAPSLIQLGQHVKAGTKTLQPVGHAQFDYGRGWWDEFWCLDEAGTGCWLSADEGDYAVERVLPKDDWPAGFRPKLGDTVKIRGQKFTVAEFADWSTASSTSSLVPLTHVMFAVAENRA